ncbi:hypothetical protein [Herbaspirillum seropedicae]|uniref:hypothetical protein n=1 Tax=Herbaspirillum seropedicae TaxID=964 RepID=UPI003FCDC001
MKQQYQAVSFRSETLRLIELMNDIIDDYVAQGYRLTVRQLYYQLVARDIIENTERSYKRTTSIVNDARNAGLMDWDAIEDRTRDFIRRASWKNGKEILNACADSFHSDMWLNQEHRVFVIVEKEALAGVLERACRRWDVPLLAARGYPSGTVLREFAEEDLLPADRSGQHAVILHFGDHDPSGLDMSRDLQERLSMFTWNQDFHFERVALNMDQIDEQDPPPNPAKTTDSRFEAYLRQFGHESWELDALPPSYLANLIDQHVGRFVDDDLWDMREKHIQATRNALVKTALAFKEPKQASL